MGIIDALLGAAESAQSWAGKATGDQRSAEGMQDAARHTEWMASSSALIEEATKKGLMTDDVRRLLGENPAAALEHLARGVGNLGAMGAGAVVEGIGLGIAGGKAIGAAAGGDFRRAGGIIRDAIDSSAMDLSNNAAGAMTYSQIKDPAARRLAIQRAAMQSELASSPGISPGQQAERASSGVLVRRR